MDSDKLTNQHSILDSVAFPIISINSNHVIDYCNNAALIEFGYSHEELKSKHIKEIVHPEDETKFYQLTPGQENVFEARVIKNDGDFQTFSCSLMIDKESKMVTCAFIKSENYGSSKTFNILSEENIAGIAEQAVFKDRLSQALAFAQRHDTKVGVLSIDLDRIDKEENLYDDETELAIGIEASKRVVNALRKTDTVSRQSPDEFIVLIPDLKNEDDVVIVGNKIINLFTESVFVKGMEINIEPIIGVAIYPTDTSDPHKLLTYADIAMVEAKDKGKVIYRIKELKELE